MTNTIDLNAMTIAQLKEFYSTLSNPISVIGTGKNGYKSKKDWIDAIEKSLISINDNDQLATEKVMITDEIPFYGEGMEPYELEELESLEELGKFREEHYQPEREIFGVPISFGWTADKLLMGIKTVTRRTWTDRYAQMFINAYKKGKLIQAFDKDRRYGGKLIGYLNLTCEPYKESLFGMPDKDIKLEGFPEMNWRQFTDNFFYDLVRDWDQNMSVVWVIRFEFIPLSSYLELQEQRAILNNNYQLPAYEYQGEYEGQKIRQ